MASTDSLWMRLVGAGRPAACWLSLPAARRAMVVMCLGLAGCVYRMQVVQEFAPAVILDDAFRVEVVLTPVGSYGTDTLIVRGSPYAVGIHVVATDQADALLRVDAVVLQAESGTLDTLVMHREFAATVSARGDRVVALGPVEIPYRASEITFVLVYARAHSESRRSYRVQLVPAPRRERRNITLDRLMSV